MQNVLTRAGWLLAAVTVLAWPLAAGAHLGVAAAALLAGVGAGASVLLLIAVAGIAVTLGRRPVGRARS